MLIKNALHPQLAVVPKAVQGRFTPAYSTSLGAAYLEDSHKILQRMPAAVAAIDCPERGQPFGNNAKQFTSEFCFGKECTVTVIDRDRYGRDVGFVECEGRDLIRELLRAGLAWHFTRYDSNPELAALEAEARTAKRGLWADPAAINPSDWRAGERGAAIHDDGAIGSESESQASIVTQCRE